MSSVLHSWGFWAFLLVVVLLVRSVLNPDPRRILSDHVMFVHATLGMGKTALAAHWVARVLHRSRVDRFIARVFRRQLPPLPVVYSTFHLEGARPFNLASGVWPSDPGCKIVIDEYLLLESNDLIPIQWFSVGCTLARQMKQQVVIISQSSRFPNRHRKFQNTVGTFLTMKGVSFGSRGRLIIVKRSNEPFIRRPKGFKADGMKTSLMWVPGRVFASYNSRMIYGYTVDNDGNWIDLVVSANNQGAAHVTAERSEAGAAHAPPRKRRVHRVKRGTVTP